MYVFVLSLLALSASCSHTKKPSTIESQIHSSFLDMDDELERKPVDPYYEQLGKLYVDTPLDHPQTEKEPIIGAEVENTIASQKLSEVPLPEVPMVLNQQVQKWINYFQGPGRKYFALWLARSGRYVPMMRQILRDNGLPEGLIYLSMIESGFKPYAYSHARAVGPWQFMRFTGERYGLRVSYWIDERMDPEKSTIAAAQHLKDLYDEFDHWYLAAAGYNAGAGKISRAINRYQTEDFWEMSKFKYLKPETKNYVPKLLAASMLASEPEKYGFMDIQYQEPIPYEKVLVPEPVSFATIATTLEIPVDVLKDLNPEIRREVTPPNYPNYELKVPVGFQSKFEAAYPLMSRYKIQDVIVYSVRSGDTLSGIAKKNGVSMTSVMEFNKLTSRSLLRKGQQVMIPLNNRGYEAKIVKATRIMPKLASNDDYQKYVVRSGDTLWNISRKFNVTVSELRKWNQLHRSSIFPGQKLVVSSQKKSELKVKQISKNET